MEDKIPIPTDNIYKFYALFGLLLFIFGSGSFIYVINATNELAFQTILQEGAMNQTQNLPPPDTAKKLVLEKRLEIAIANRKFFFSCIGVIIGAGGILMFYGFIKWHTEVQPIQNEIAKLQLEKLRHEVKQLKRL